MKYFLSIAILLIASACMAQITYKPGYFVDNSGNKISCLIKDVAWKDNPVEFDYKANESAITQKGIMKNVKEFSVGGYKFKRFTVSIDPSPTVADMLSTSTVPEWETRTIFLKILVEGSANLYQYENDNVLKYFFSSGNHDTAEQLMYREHKENTTVKINNKFRQQLYMLMKDKLEDMKRYEKIRYLKNDLIKLFLEYNDGTGEMKDHSIVQNKSSVNIKITPGVSLVSLTLEDFINGTQLETDSKTAFRIGVEAEYIMPFNNNKWALFIEPNVQFHKYESKQGNYNVEAEYNFLEIPVGARHYMFLTNNSKVFISAAYMVSLNIGDPYFQVRNLKQGIAKSSNFAAGLGFAHKRYSAEVRYSFERGLAETGNTWGATNTSIGLILGYKIF